MLSDDVRRRRTATGLLVGLLVSAAVFVLTYVVLIRTGWGQRLDDAAYFGRAALGRHFQLFDRAILDIVVKATLVVVAIGMLVVGYLRRVFLVAVIAVAAWGFAIVGAEVFKMVLPRPDLVPDSDYSAGFLDNWYPSGHATITTSFGLALILLAPTRWRTWVSFLAGIISASYATGVLFAGWHRPSDAIGGIAWSGICIAGAALVSVILRGRAGDCSPYVRQAVLVSGGLAVLMIGFVWLVVANTADEYPDADMPFLLLTAVIIASSFAITAWFGWQLREVDWVEPD